MRAITFLRDIPAHILDIELKAGVEYLVHDQQARDFSRWRGTRARFERQYAMGDAAARAGFDKMRSFMEAQSSMGDFTSRSAEGILREWKCPANLDKKRILFLRPGGYGDMLMMAPLLKKIKACWKKVYIGVSCMPRFGAILQGIPYIDEYAPWPAAVPSLAEWDYHVNFENTIEFNPAGKTTHAAELFGQQVNLPIRPEDHAIEFEPGAHKMPEWLPKQKAQDEKWIGIFCGASAKHRCWPPDWILALINALALDGYKVCLLGKKEDFGLIGFHVPAPGNKTTLAGFLRAPANILPTLGAFENILQTADFMRRYLDFIISPDSIGIHLCGAMKLPCLGFYGPFAAATRCKYYPTVEAMEGKAECAPCCSHDVRPPCGLAWCKALDTISPEAVFRFIQSRVPRSSVLPAAGEKRLLTAVRLDGAQGDVRLHPAGDRKPSLRVAR